MARMGRLIADEIAANRSCVLAGGAVRQLRLDIPTPKDVLITTDTSAVIAASDVVVDFTTAAATPDNAKLATKLGKAFMTGTTGLDASGIDALQKIASEIPVLYAPNTSLVTRCDKTNRGACRQAFEAVRL